MLLFMNSEEFEAQMADICYQALKEQGASAWIKCIRPTFKDYSGFVKNLLLSLKQKFELFIIQLKKLNLRRKVLVLVT